MLGKLAGLVPIGKDGVWGLSGSGNIAEFVTLIGHIMVF